MNCKGYIKVKERIEVEEMNRPKSPKEVRHEKIVRQRKIIRLSVCLVLLAVVLGGIVLAMKLLDKNTKSKDVSGNLVVEEPVITEEEQAALVAQQEAETRSSLILQANTLASGYDYDGAIALLQTYTGYEQHTEMTEAIASFETTKSGLVLYDVQEVTHIFFHSLIVDTQKAFDGDEDAGGYNQVMATVDEFNNIMQTMYDKGYVLVRLHDIATKTIDENGNEKFVPGEIYLPEGKKPFVLSQDDVSYYEYMEGDGFATRIVLEADGRPTCEMLQEDGTVVTGDYDMVPLIESFVKAHPDFSYKGARGVLALTGYNGVLGYRTDPEYAANPTYQQDIEDAKRVAQGLRDWGWEFASHSYGHLNYGTITDERFKKDTQKWEDTVENIIGETDILIYPFGADIADWRGYQGERFEYLKTLGFDYYCNVDGSTPYWVQISDRYVRQGRRNIDGVRMYQDIENPTLNRLGDLFDVPTIFDAARPTPVEGL